MSSPVSKSATSLAKNPVAVKVNLAGGSQTMAMASDEYLRDLKTKLKEKIEKKGGKPLPDPSSFVFQVTDSGLLLSNDDITLLDVYTLENLAVTRTLVLTIKEKDEIKHSMPATTILAANYKTGMLNFQKDPKPQIKTKKMLFFVLDEFSLFQYENPDDQTPKNTHIVHADCEIDVDEQYSTPKMFYLILKQHGAEAFRLGCATNDERRQWITCLTTARLCHFRFVLEQCVTHLNEHALQVPGLFRTTARDNEVVALKKQLDEAHTDLDLSKVDAHVVATTLKRYLKSLPEPILTYELYPRFIATQQIADEDERAHGVSVVLSLLAPINKLLLQYLIAFLARVSGFYQTNEMSAAALATVFSPSLLAKKGETPEDAIADTTPRHNLIRLLISEYDYFFSDDGNDTDHDIDVESGHGSSDEKTPPLLQKSQSQATDHGGLSMVTPRPEPLQKPQQQQQQQQQQAQAQTTNVGAVGAAAGAQATSAEPTAAQEYGGPPNPNNLPVARATFDFEAKDPQHQMSLKKGDWVLILKKNPTGWWLGECEGRKGLFPYNYVKIEEKKDASSAAEKVLSSAPVYMGAPRRQSLRLTGGAPGGPQMGVGMGAAGGPGGIPADGGILRQRFEEEAHARRHAEESRKALATLLEEARRANLAEQKIRDEMTQRINTMILQISEMTARTQALEKDKEQSTTSQAALHKTIAQLQAESTNAVTSRDMFLSERGKVDAAIKLAVQTVSTKDKDRVGVILQQAMTATAPPPTIAVAEQLAIENGRRAELERHCISLSGTVQQMLPMAAGHVIVQGKAGLADDLWIRHNARVSRQLEIAKAVAAQMAQMQLLLQEEVDDIVNVFAS